MSQIVTNYDALPAWFREEVESREIQGRMHETAHGGVRWALCGVLGFAVNGPTWAFASSADSTFSCDAVADPLVRLEPSAPIPMDQTNSPILPDALLRQHPDLCKYVVPMGAHDIHVSLGLYVAIVGAFAAKLEWFGSGPSDPVVAHANGQLVALVMPVRTMGDEYDAGEAAAARVRAMRRQTVTT